MKIIIKSITGLKNVIQIEKNETVFTLKQKYQEISGIPILQQKLLCFQKIGIPLDDKKTIDSYNLSDGEIVSCVLNLRGGMYHPTSGVPDVAKTSTFITKFVHVYLKIDIITEFDFVKEFSSKLIRKIFDHYQDATVDELFADVLNLIQDHFCISFNPSFFLKRQFDATLKHELTNLFNKRIHG